MAWYDRFLNTMRPERVSDELDREMGFHLSEAVDELMAGGMSEAEARREARLRFGNPALQRERARERDVLPWLESLAADLRYALRSLRANPGFAAVAVLSLALGIGANTAIFSLIDAVILKPLPVERPHELMRVTTASGEAELTNPIWEAIRDRQDAFSGAFAFAGQSFDLASGGEARPVAGAWVSGDFFGTLGVVPAAGRLLAPYDDRRGCAATAVLGHAFWRSRYGGDPGVVGRTVSLNGHPFEIVGVAAPGFFGAEVGRETSVYAPLCSKAIVDGGDGGLDERSMWFLQVMGRRAPGLTEPQVDARLAAIAPAVFAATVPENWDEDGRRSYARNRLAAEPAANGPSGVRREYSAALVALMAVVGLVLLIACANVAHLLLARAATRRREVAIRIAIGAGRARLVRQLLTESVVLALLGAALGLLLAIWLRGALLRFIPGDQDTVSLDLPLDGRLLAFNLAVAAATAILFGLAPAWRATRVDPQSAMKARERGVAQGHSRFTLGKALVVGQIALSLVLVLGAGLLLGSFRRLATLDPGFEHEGILLASLDLRGSGAEGESGAAVRREILDRVRAAPGVESAAASSITPISGAGWNGVIAVDGFTPAGERDALVFFNAVTDGFFPTLRTPLLAGRDFAPADNSTSAVPVVIVNEALARKFFRGENPVGRQMVIFQGPSSDGVAHEVVGVVRDAKYRSLREEENPVAYLPLGQDSGAPPFLNLELRGGGSAASLAPAVTAALAELDPGISIHYTTLSEQVGASVSRERLLATLTAAFGALALLLAAVGLYGTMAYAVAQRRNEIAVRIAVGAARARVMRLVLGEVGRLVAVGLLLGGAAAWYATRWVAQFLFGLTPTDPLTWGLAAITLAVAAGIAGALPAWQAARVDPVAALRAD